MSDLPNMSSATKEIIAKVRLMVPPLLDKFHKGQLGRIAVVGGSKNYTGAPFFSANASAHLGADLSYVICEPSAAPDPSPPTAESVASSVFELMSRIHVMVIGPGLGRDELMQAAAKKIIAKAREDKIPLVLDADALMIVNAEPDFVKNWKEVVLTPNVVEFGRLAKAVGVDIEGTRPEEACERVSAELGGVCIVQKGEVDYISAAGKTWICDLQGGKKRSGGQGDTLTGSIATFLGWRKAYLDGIWDVEGALGEDELVMLAAFGGAAVTRECSRLAFKEKGRALQASDVGEKVPQAFLNVIGEKESSKL